MEGVTDGATDSGRLVFRTQPDGGALTERMRIDHDGIITKPNQPCFHAYPATTTTTLNSTNATWEKLPFDSTAWNVGNHFSTTNKDLRHQLLECI